MKIILLLCTLAASVHASEGPPYPDVFRVEFQGLKDFPRTLKIESTIEHTIEVPAETTTQLISLGCAATGLTIIGIGTCIIFNSSKEGQVNIAPLAVGASLLGIGYVLNTWNKKAADDTVQQDSEQMVDTSNSQHNDDNLSS